MGSSLVCSLSPWHNNTDNSHRFTCRKCWWDPYCSSIPFVLLVLFLIWWSRDLLRLSKPLTLFACAELMIRSASLSTRVSGKESKQPGERIQGHRCLQWPSLPISPTLPILWVRRLKSVPPSCPWSVIIRINLSRPPARNRYRVRRRWVGGWQRWISWLLSLSLRLMLKLVPLRPGLWFGKRCMIRSYNAIALLLLSLYLDTLFDVYPAHYVWVIWHHL